MPDDSILILLSCGKFAVVDADDAERVCVHRWHVHTKGYAYRSRVLSDGPGPPTILLHRSVLNAPSGTRVDHKNRHKLDCRKHNLRYATSSQNRMNAAVQKNNRSGFRGVSWNTSLKKWRAQVRVDRRQHHIGYFDTLEEAALARDAFAISVFGEFAWTHQIEGNVIE